ncbi:unnamed protein product [Rangifer tarandus platyrhynchus]|uniref:Uncharacterized protein n=2 Tax=Rangifer tarandus platyrhynchus TaxID=3082113 RepID=A0ABN8Y7Z9_RANTA|nr:unnamed protein product [Rangifer tarandus platyrhynchus]
MRVLRPLELLLHLEEECKEKNPGKKSRAGEMPRVSDCLHCSKTSRRDDQCRCPLSYSRTVSGFLSPSPTQLPRPFFVPYFPPPLDISDFSTSSCAQVTLPSFSSCPNVPLTLPACISRLPW